MNFEKQTVIRSPAERVFAFHELPDALERLMPPWDKAKIIQKADISIIGSEAVIDITIFGPFGVRWVAKHTAYDPPHMFEDTQVSGPFKNWRHKHIVEPHPEGAVLRDEIDYAPPFGRFGAIAMRYAMAGKLEKMFDHRHRVTKEWCESAIEDFEIK